MWRKVEHSFLFSVSYNSIEGLEMTRISAISAEKILNISTVIQSEMVLIVICCLTVEWTLKHESADRT